MGKQEKSTEKRAKASFEPKDPQPEEVASAEAELVRGGRAKSQDFTVSKPVDKAAP